MILVKITGGPGNQLFQYAVGSRLSDYHKTELFLDISEYAIKKHRQFLLDRFKIKAQYADKNILKSFLKFSYYIPYDLRPRIHRLFPFNFKKIIYEKHFHFDKRTLSVKNDKYLIGFWQSEKYFSDIEGKLSRELTLKNGLSKASKKLLYQIKNTNSVSMNIRRGDFVSDPRIFKRHGVLDYTYYKNAVSIIAKKISSPHLFIFSDDITWVKKNWRFPHKVTFADFNFPVRQEEDLILGSFCKHHIIANSTFSWWVAWLNQNKNKITIAPRQWFNQLNYDTHDLYPDNWIIIP